MVVQSVMSAFTSHTMGCNTCFDVGCLCMSQLLGVEPLLIDLPLTVQLSFIGMYDCMTHGQNSM